MDPIAIPPPMIPEMSPPEAEPSTSSECGSSRRAGSVSDDESLSGLTTQEERLAAADSAREEGNRLLREADFKGAIETYKRGLKSLKKMELGGVDDLSSSLKTTKVALSSNLSLAHMKLQDWLEGSKAAGTALEIDPDNIKALFRRGMCYSKVGFFDEARKDLLRVCTLEPGNLEARRELASIRERDAEARRRNKQSFGKLFSQSGSSLYSDREAQELAKREQEEKAFQEENLQREAKGEKPIESLEAWREMKAEAQEKKARKNEGTPSKESKASAKITKTSSSSKIEDIELDEEDRRIIDETKKMGYCYFDKRKNDGVSANASQGGAISCANRPERIESPSASQCSKTSGAETNQANRALSTWNKEGTTYEEKDCSTWAREEARRCLRSIPQIPVEIEGTKYTCTVSESSSVEGDAHIVVIRAAKRYIYDLQLRVDWEIKESDAASAGGRCLAGQLHLEDVSSACSSSETKGDGVRIPDWFRDARVTYGSGSRPSDPKIEQLASSALEKLKKAVLSAITDKFEAAFHLYA